MSKKRCTKCGGLKLVAEFSRDAKASDGLQCRCKECRKAADRKRYEANPEVYKARRRKRRKTHTEACKAADRKYRKTHPERCKLRDQEHRKTHRKARNAVSLAWYRKQLKTNRAKSAKWHREHRESGRKCEATRRARKKEAFVEAVDPQVVYERDGGKCYICGEPVTFEEMHLEHVIPLSKDGKHSYSNCKCACAHCNLSKGAKVAA